MDDQLPRLADALRRRHMIDAEIATIVGRAMTSGHAGEWIAARIFDLELEASAGARAIDGRFRRGIGRGECERQVVLEAGGSSGRPR